jgi:hypothetical protein
MNPDELASLVQAQQASDEERARGSKKKRAKHTTRYVTLEEKEDGLQLTIRGYGRRLVAGGVLLCVAVVCLPFIGLSSWVYLFAAGFAVVGVYYLLTARSTYRILATADHFAIFEGASTKPIKYGELHELRVSATSTVAMYCMISTFRNGKVWSARLTGFSHRGDLADANTFGKRIARS